MKSLTYRLAAKLGAALFTTALLAQPAFAQAPDKPKPRMERDCSKAPDPARCEGRRKEMRAAADACKAKPQGERRACMSEAVCAKSEDPAKCKARHAERAERQKARHAERQKAREACKGREGEARKDCMREQHGKKKPPAKS
ncbi:MAG: hypothetical protein O2975_06755 [Proteobacteria bacterium]|nr:hypothetical protein [Pseudomonadota bacterium]